MHRAKNNGWGLYFLIYVAVAMILGMNLVTGVVYTAFRASLVKEALINYKCVGCARVRDLRRSTVLNLHFCCVAGHGAGRLRRRLTCWTAESAATSTSSSGTTSTWP